MQAVILAGGEGTRLRPLTTLVAKPVVTLVDRPFIVYMLQWLRRHGADDVILCCGFGADGVRAVLGDGSRYGVRLRYVEESVPLGTAGPLLLAQELLEERFLVCNGDVLTDIDLSAQLRAHADTGAQATLALVEVEDPSAYGLVRCDTDGAVVEFIEKPTGAISGPPLISAGAYVLERGVLELIEPGRAVSIEREVWPKLVGHGLYGHHATGYWLDIGTPARYLQASFDIITGAVTVEHSPEWDGAIGEECEIAPDAELGELVVLGERVHVGACASIERSVVLADARIGEHCVLRESIVAERAKIGAYAELEEDVVIGADAEIAAHSRVAAGTRVGPGESL
jgi:mannose-1-phosphate guanylyltransferase